MRKDWSMLAYEINGGATEFSPNKEKQVCKQFYEEEKKLVFIFRLVNVFICDNCNSGIVLFFSEKNDNRKNIVSH